MRGNKLYHPLRQLSVGGNPNKRVVPNKDDKHPLIDGYLLQRGVEPLLYHQFVRSVTCKVVTPLLRGYQKGRAENDPAYSKFPVFIVYCENVTDVVKTVNFCRSAMLKVCMRAGGHSIAGYSVLDWHVVIDVSQIKGVVVDPVGLTATAGAGVTWSDYNYVLDSYGLHNPGGSCSTVGITGYTLGGGYGYTSMQWGMGCDNLIALTMVDYNGTIVTANQTTNSDLLWAHQGGTGGNFGVVVSLTYKLRAMRMVFGAINEVAADATAFVHRNAYFNIFTDAFWLKDEDKAPAFSWLKGFYESAATQPLWSDSYYQNYPNPDYTAWQTGYFGTNYTKLQQLKQDWDPQNFFHYQQSIELP